MSLGVQFSPAHRGEFGRIQRAAASGVFTGRPVGAFGRQILGARAGEYFLSAHVGRGLAIADLDNDGDYDAIINHVDALPAVLRNTTIRSSTHKKHSILLRLIGTRGSRDAVGAKVTAFLPGRTRQFEIVGGGSYLSASDQRIIMALNPDESISRVEIQWPDGKIGRAHV